MGEKGFLDSLKRNGLIWVILLYLLLFIGYQGFEESIKQTVFGISQQQNVYQIDENIHLGIEYPHTISLPGDDEILGRPMTLWVWEDPQDFIENEDVEVSFSSEEDGVIFSNREGVEVSPSFDLPIGKASATAPRKTLYLQKRRGNTKTENPVFSIQIYEGEKITLPPRRFVLHLETPVSLILRRVLKLLFGGPILALVTGLIGIIKFFLDRRDKRLKDIGIFYSKIDDLRELFQEDISNVGRQYLQIWKWVTEQHLLGESYSQELVFNFQEMTNKYENGRPWLLSARYWVSKHLNDTSTMRDDWLSDLKKSRVGFFKEELTTIEEFIGLLNQPSIQLSESLLEEMLEVFTILRVAGEESILSLVEGVKPVSSSNMEERNYKYGEEKEGEEKEGEDKESSDKKSITDEEQLFINLLEETWYRNGGATGRYLLDQLATKEGFLWMKEVIKNWENNPQKPQEYRKKGMLWPNTSELSKKWNLSTPFGPTKGEYDGRLLSQRAENDSTVAGLFWEEHSVWKNIVSVKDGWFSAPPGFGTSTFIWMGRYERDFWGSRPSFSIYLKLCGTCSECIFWNKFEEALAESLLRVLSIDPFWLINANTETQDQVSAFLLSWADDDLALLLRRLSDWGIDDKERDGQFLYDFLAHHALRAHAYNRKYLFSILDGVRENLMLAASNRIGNKNEFKVFVWIELVLPKIRNDLLNDWVKVVCAQEELWQDTVLKVFDPVDNRSIKFNNNNDIGKHKITWNADEIKACVIHRINQSYNASEFLTENKLDLKSEWKKMLDVQSPAELIELGNELWTEEVREE